MSGTRALAFWLFVFLSISPLLANLLVFAGVQVPFPVFRIFESVPLIWRTAFLMSGFFAVLTAYLIRDRKKTAVLSAFAFLILYAPSFKVVWGQVSFGILAAIVATGLATYVSLTARKEA